LRWEIPRELLWAIIGAQAIFIIALWPMYYPYGQAPKVQPQHQAGNSISGDNATNHRPTSQVSPGGEQQRERGGENATDILGIKPGEWLLSIVTFMLWVATVGLVRGADRTAERQLRAYIDLRWAEIQDFEVGEQPSVMVTFRNVGQTPAKDVRVTIRLQLRPANEPPDNVEIEGGPGASKSTVASRGKFKADVAMAGLLTADQYRAVEDGEAALFLYGIVRYDDIFGNSRFTRLRWALTADGMLYRGNTFQACEDGNDTN
jgi:hypothetical protein